MRPLALNEQINVNNLLDIMVLCTTVDLIRVQLTATYQNIGRSVLKNISAFLIAIIQQSSADLSVNNIMLLVYEGKMQRFA